MDLNQSQAEFLEGIIDEWRQKELLSEEKSVELKKSFTIRKFNWMAVAQYAFVAAIVCGIVAVVATFADKNLISFFERMVDKIYNAPNAILAILCGSLAAIFFYFADKRKQQRPNKIFTNEGLILLGIAFTAFTSANIAKLIGNGNIYYISVFLIATSLYIAITYWLKNFLVWLFVLLGISSCFITCTSVPTNWHPYFWGLNLPLRLLLFSSIFIFLIDTIKKIPWLKKFYNLSFYYWILLFFISLWAVSVYGNYGNIEQWNNVKQIYLWPWAALSIIISVIVTYWAWKKDNAVLRNFGVSFLFINIYTRYFEYFWDSMPKAVFFIILALSFWIIGRKAEKIWNL
ncbi:hypothetical protein [Arachidicoccus soli]|uniref:DUF2157 domain-containing protein n=1 Tax=Arachidicoccus soli TaxID=2341117 RepID=A0A386HKV8_9BACT|nr:hypothetical protein [Arachidicoccus soli]AYD46259.1 hypothetical protein D6B99_00665 [Arachidicoccus soli]